MFGKSKSAIIRYIAGLIILCFGVVLNTKTGLGVAAINAIPFVLSYTKTISLGMGVFIVYCVLIILQLILKRKVEIMVILQLPVSLLFGCLVDYFNGLVFHDGITNPIFSLIVLFVAINLVALGTVLVVGADIIPNAPDGFVNTLAKVIDKSFGKVKLGFDFIFVFVAAIFSLILCHKIIGIGLGTILSMTFTGYMCEFYKKKITRR